MLPFERLAQADSRSLQTLVREAEAQVLMLALQAPLRIPRCFSRLPVVQSSRALCGGNVPNGARSEE